MSKLLTIFGHMCIDLDGLWTLWCNFATLLGTVVLSSGVRNTLSDASNVCSRPLPTLPMPEDTPILKMTVFSLLLMVYCGFSFRRSLLALQLG